MATGKGKGKSKVVPLL